MPTAVVVPRLGIAMTSAIITEWYQPDGASVCAGDPVFCIETDHIAFDVECESDGILRHRAPAGRAYAPGEPAAFVLAIGERLPANLAADPSPAAKRPTSGSRSPRREPAAASRIEPERPATPQEARNPSQDNPAVVEERVVPLRRSMRRPPASYQSFDRASTPDFSDGGPFSAPPLEGDWDSFARGPAAGIPRTPDGAREGPPVATASATRPPPPRQTLRLQAHVNLVEARKLCAQLEREWHAQGLTPGDEDVIVRAFALAIASHAGLAPGDATTLRIIGPQGDTSFAIPNPSAPFHEAVASRRSVPAEGNYCERPASVVSFAAAGVHVGECRLAPGQSIALASGAAFPWPALNGSQATLVPHLTLTLAFDAATVSDHRATVILARVRELIEAPYALLAA